MINFRIIFKIIGSLLFIEALFMTWCAAMAFYFHEEDQIAFLMSLLITFGSGFFFLLLGRNANNMLSRKDAFLLVTAVWVIFSFFGMFPFLIHGCIPNITDAFFETMSGFTTTGASIIDDVEVLPHGILFWRSLMQWIGGLGIVFFTIAILPSLVGGSVKVFAAEATGPVKAKMHPRLTTTAKWIWSIYLLLTIGCGIAFWLAGMNWFDATNYSMTTTATGGFSIHNDSLAFFHDPTIDYIAIVFQFLAGINFTLLYASIFKAKFADLFKNSEFKFYISILLLSTAGIATVLYFQSGYELEPAIRSSLFHVVSFMTTTGMFNDDVALWPHITWIILGALMFIGGCAGSTSGGFKCIPRRPDVHRRLCRQHQRRIQMYPCGDDAEVAPQQLPSDPPPQRCTACENQRPECATGQDGSPVRLLHTLHTDDPRHRWHHAPLEHRHDQQHRHRPELR